MFMCACVCVCLGVFVRNMNNQVQQYVQRAQSRVEASSLQVCVCLKVDPLPVLEWAAASCVVCVVTRFDKLWVIWIENAEVADL
jgi:hypothetical protein